MGRQALIILQKIVRSGKETFFIVKLLFKADLIREGQCALRWFLIME